jgi:hypothetical protein
MKPKTLQFMKLTMFAVITAVAMLETVSAARADLTIYPNPDPTQAKPSDRYSVQARQGTNAWQTIPVYDLFGPQEPYNHDITAQPHIAYFDSTGDVQLRVKVSGVMVSNYVVRPTIKEVVSTRSGDQITLTMTDAKRQLCLEVNDEPKQSLLLFSNSPETNIPSTNDPNVLYFGSGYTKLQGASGNDRYVKTYRGKSNLTIYIAGGAILEGAFVFENCSNITLRGHGILASRHVENAGPALFRNGTSNSRVEDLIVTCDNEGYGLCFSCTTGCDVKNTKVVTRIRDGINTTSSLKRTITDCFIMAHDDAITASDSYEEYWNPLDQDLDGMTVERCVIAQMGGGNPFRIWGDSTKNSLKNITVRDCDVIYALCGYDPGDHWSQAVFEFSSEGGGAISNVLFDNIRIEKQTKQNVFEVRPRKGPASVDNVVFRNVSCLEKPIQPSRIEGLSDSPMSNISIENYQILGARVTNPKAGNITIGANTSNIKIQ